MLMQPFFTDIHGWACATEYEKEIFIEFDNIV
jgi:hypothetical protein